MPLRGGGKAVGLEISAGKERNAMDSAFILGGPIYNGNPSSAKISPLWWARRRSGSSGISRLPV